MNRLTRPVQFAFEPDVVSIFARIAFGAAGAPTLNTNFSKGLCNFAASSVSFTGTTDGTTAVVTAVSSFAGLYVGQTVTGVGIPAATTISSMNAGASTITLSANTTSAHVAEAMSAAGGLYIMQFGQQAGVRLDTYNRLLKLQHSWDETASQGGATTRALAPNAPSMILVNNSVSIRTIPAVGSSASTDATLSVQFGSGNGTSFVAGVPNNGDTLILSVSLTRSSAI